MTFGDPDMLMEEKEFNKIGFKVRRVIEVFGLLTSIIAWFFAFFYEKGLFYSVVAWFFFLLFLLLLIMDIGKGKK